MQHVVELRQGRDAVAPSQGQKTNLGNADAEGLLHIGEAKAQRITRALSLR